MQIQSAAMEQRFKAIYFYRIMGRTNNDSSQMLANFL